MYPFPLLFLNNKVERLERFSFLEHLDTVCNQKGCLKITVIIKPFTQVKLISIINIHEISDVLPLKVYNSIFPLL